MAILSLNDKLRRQLLLDPKQRGNTSYFRMGGGSDEELYQPMNTLENVMSGQQYPVAPVISPEAKKERALAGLIAQLKDRTEDIGYDPRNDLKHPKGFIDAINMKIDDWKKEKEIDKEKTRMFDAIMRRKATGDMSKFRTPTAQQPRSGTARRAPAQPTFPLPSAKGINNQPSKEYLEKEARIIEDLLSQGYSEQEIIAGARQQRENSGYTINR